MDSRWFGLIELLLVFGLVLGWAVWQWWGVRKWRQQQRHQQADAERDRHVP